MEQRTGDNHSPLPLDREQQEYFVVDHGNVDDRKYGDAENDDGPEEYLVLEQVHAEDRLCRMLANEGMDHEDDQETGKHSASSSTGVIADVLPEVLVAVDTEISVKVTPHDDRKVGNRDGSEQETVEEEVKDPPEGKD